ncbi:putative transposase/invertase (TIGR01784 family), partial [Paenibacillus eucommiae]|nr:putative transposase/invertase (TIGR01784 family) [Paenibacillus eucommiae]
LRIKKKLDDARLALIMSVADIYFQPDKEQDEAILLELSELYPEEGEAIMELMPAWKRWGYEEGIERGIEQGKEEIIRKFLGKGFSPEEIAETLELPVGEVLKLIKQ